MDEAEYKCPKCQGSNFKVWKLPNPIVLHWVLNPGLAFNEIILGQRIPKVQLICQNCEGNLMDRGYIPCPCCHTMHWGRLWSRKRGFGNWRGISCPKCGKPIPCVWNVFSRGILALTFPIWSLPYFLYFRNKPVKPMYQAEDGCPPKPKPVTTKTWAWMGILYGGLMWLCMCVLPGVFFHSKDGRLSWARIIAELPIWVIGGLAFGFLMWFSLGRKAQSKKASQRDPAQ